jgi:hypothetical protein
LAPFLSVLTTTGATTFGGSTGVSSLSNFFSSVAYSFLKVAISLLKNSSLSFNFDFISLKHSL